jgi:DNA-binding CsgD family transcriptional regulator
VETLSISRSPSASAREDNAAAVLATGRTFKIGLSLDDDVLEQALRRLMPSRPEIVEAAEGASVIVTDRPAGDGFGGKSRVLRIGSDRGAPGEHVFDNLDPQLILSAAVLLAAGYHTGRLPDDDDEDATPVRLSQRERQVAELLVEGASNKVIARELDISVHTAKFHVTAVMDKLGARNRADAVAIALREGFVTL